MGLELAIMPLPGWEANTVNTAQFALKGIFGGSSVILTTAASACNAGLGVGSPLPHIYVFDARAQLYEKHFCFEIRHKGFCSHY